MASTPIIVSYPVPASVWSANRYGGRREKTDCYVRRDIRTQILSFETATGEAIRAAKVVRGNGSSELMVIKADGRFWCEADAFRSSGWPSNNTDQLATVRKDDDTVCGRMEPKIKWGRLHEGADWDAPETVELYANATNGMERKELTKKGRTDLEALLGKYALIDGILHVECGEPKWASQSYSITAEFHQPGRHFNAKAFSASDLASALVYSGNCKVEGSIEILDASAFPSTEDTARVQREEADKAIREFLISPYGYDNLQGLGNEISRVTQRRDLKLASASVRESVHVALLARVIKEIVANDGGLDGAGLLALAEAAIAETHKDAA